MVADLPLESLFEKNIITLHCLRVLLSFWDGYQLAVMSVGHVWTKCWTKKWRRMPSLWPGIFLQWTKRYWYNWNVWSEILLQKWQLIPYTFWKRWSVYFSYFLWFSLSKIKSSLYSHYYTEACNEWRDPFPLLCVWATQLWRNVSAVTSRRRHCVRFDRPRNRTPNLPRW